MRLTSATSGAAGGGGAGGGGGTESYKFPLQIQNWVAFGSMAGGASSEKRALGTGNFS